ncbi:MAG TPA: c-type cytochrome domain-containing protein, partial [Chitinophagaceae bacterium]|nr:c-type cytochrome domain-containing protein [Chitinophagaceae bacterium]
MYRKKNTIPVAFVFMTVCLLVACRHEPFDAPAGSDPSVPSATCSSDTVYFAQQVLPILQSNCALGGCHDAATRRDGVELTSYDRVMATAGIRPGDPDDSKLFEMITESDAEDRMPPPPRPALTADQKALIGKWIGQGARNNSCLSACDTSSVTFAAVIQPMIRNKCQGCHSGSAPSGGISLATYAGIKARVTDGRLWGAVHHQAGFSPMPQGG